MLTTFFPASIYLFKVNNGSTGTRCQIFLKLADTSAKSLTSFGLFIVYFEHVLDIVLVFSLLTLNK